MNILYHKDLAAGRWFQLSLEEQLANIGSEVGRAAKWQHQNKENFQGAVQRALELFDLTLQDPRWRKQKRLREIARAREVFCDALYGGKEYGTSFQDLDRYFFSFAMMARKGM